MRCCCRDTFAEQAADILGKEDVTLDYKDGFWLATMGGAACLNLQDDIGSFDVGKFFDAALVDVGKSEVFDVFASDTMLDRFQKYINLGDDRNIVQVFVAGKACDLDA